MKLECPQSNPNQFGACNLQLVLLVFVDDYVECSSQSLARLFRQNIKLSRNAVSLKFSIRSCFWFIQLSNKLRSRKPSRPQQRLNPCRYRSEIFSGPPSVYGGRALYEENLGNADTGPAGMTRQDPGLFGAEYEKDRRPEEDLIT